ncbi:ribonuclease HII [Methanohalobium evestigatum Z-7303]|uniref:Ribonuclease HII n=1 Tax=Methanohalobium evestigatum (strain ATCC BAA-1072 / DSM 3721 / NBRC 107634 / OCM 161 / Z-7303) TaxID=644295 RepID=D7E880_METEZ|nr:ribonuclease HII [Methanohalobium evestigatum]ADI73422.1 ribonuclease HII [Methanohalobium evestigatum Z-7303]
MKVAGIDEAGKGPVIGSMCIAGVVVDEAKINSLKNLGVTDSKKISPRKREELAHKIKKYVDNYFIFEITPSQIDELRNVMSMNDIMVLGFSRVVENLNPELVYVDSADVKPERFAEKIRSEYSKSNKTASENIKIISEHEADVVYSVVSAASIIAKVRRDELVNNLKEEFGVDFGSGYPSDPKTKQFLLDWVKRYGSLPDIVRHSWKTAQKLLDKNDG